MAFSCFFYSRFRSFLAVINASFASKTFFFWRLALPVSSATGAVTFGVSTLSVFGFRSLTRSKYKIGF
jgi:hypothetical protein